MPLSLKQRFLKHRGAIGALAGLIVGMLGFDAEWATLVDAAQSIADALSSVDISQGAGQ